MIDRNSNAEDLNQHAEPGSPEYEKALRAINFLDGIRDADRSGDRETAHLNPEVTVGGDILHTKIKLCLLYTSPSPRDRTRSRMPSSA